MILSHEFTRIALTPSGAMKEKHPEKRSWWINPQGKIFDSGYDHVKFLEERPGTFGKYPDINKALTLDWTRVAFWGGEYVVHCHSINPDQITSSQKIYNSIGGVNKIFIGTLNKSGYIDRTDFLTADSQTDLLRNLFKDPSGIRGSIKVSGSRSTTAASKQRLAPRSF